MAASCCSSDDKDCPCARKKEARDALDGRRDKILLPPRDQASPVRSSSRFCSWARRPRRLRVASCFLRYPNRTRNAKRTRARRPPMAPAPSKPASRTEAAGARVVGVVPVVVTVVVMVEVLSVVAVKVAVDVAVEVAVVVAVLLLVVVAVEEAVEEAVVEPVVVSVVETVDVCVA